jgi:hypothetical protein
MKDFNLTKFLTENKLTRASKLVEVAGTIQNVNINSIEVGGVDPADRPDYSDAYIDYAEYEDGTPLTPEELMQYQEENYGIIHDVLMNRGEL